MRNAVEFCIAERIQSLFAIFMHGHDSRCQPKDTPMIRTTEPLILAIPVKLWVFPHRSPSNPSLGRPRQRLTPATPSGTPTATRDCHHSACQVSHRVSNPDRCCCHGTDALPWPAHASKKKIPKRVRPKCIRDFLRLRRLRRLRLRKIPTSMVRATGSKDPPLWLRRVENFMA